jgi:hypothetical protein
MKLGAAASRPRLKILSAIPDGAAGKSRMYISSRELSVQATLNTPLNFPSIKRAGRDPAIPYSVKFLLYSLGLTGAISHPAISRTATSPRAIGVCELNPESSSISLAEGKPKTLNHHILR